MTELCQGLMRLYIGVISFVRDKLTLNVVRIVQYVHKKLSSMSAFIRDSEGSSQLYTARRTNALSDCLSQWKIQGATGEPLWQWPSCKFQWSCIQYLREWIIIFAT